MAKAQQQEQTLVKLAMIVFAALWLASMVLFFFVYTGQEQLQNEVDQARKDKDRLISTEQERSVPLVQTVKPGGETLVGLIWEERNEIARLATGVSGDDPAAVQGKRDQQLRTIRSERLVSDPGHYEDLSYEEALSTLYGEFGTKVGLQREAAGRVQELQAEVERQVELNAQQKNELDVRAKELGDQLTQEQTARTEYRADRDAEIARIRQEYEQRTAETERDLTAERETVAMLEERVDVLQERLTAMQDKFGELMMGPEPLSTARRADGRILTAMPGDNVVYIDLGQKDQLTLGLQFAVYSSDSGIPTNGRSKAQIEVVSMSQGSAECKILRVAPRETILAGDLVANPVYDPNRSLRFLVLGDFDLDHDGAVDQSGAATIESMIDHWGGQTVTELSALTDFVVIGRAPRRPRRVTDASSEQSRRAEAKQQLYDQYVNTVDSAKSLAVPIMTQEVFLNFLGFAGR